MIRWLYISLSVFFFTGCNAQPATQQADTVPGTRTGKSLPGCFAPVVHIAAAGGSLYALNKSWYSKYPPASFHTVNDVNNWRGMDKCGHAWSAYAIARLSGALWQASGLNHGQATCRAGLIALGYQTTIEIMDGFSSEWGFSWGDMGANIFGAGTYVLQEIFLQKQAVHIKFMSFGKIAYPAVVRERANELFGTTAGSRLLNDYNAQTYWLSINLKTILPVLKVPRWLNVAVGYGASQMLGTAGNQWLNKDNIIIDRSDMLRYSRIFISPDIDLTCIKTKHAWLRTALFILNAVKIPAPALQYNTTGKLRWRWMLFN